MPTSRGRPRGRPPGPKRVAAMPLPEPEEMDVDTDVSGWETHVPEDRDPMDLADLSKVERAQLLEVLAEFAEREMEALAIFEPMPEQERFFASAADERLGIGGNRGGKTTATCVEIARAVTGQDPHDKYPKRDGRCILVGKDLTHCSKVFYTKLFKPGAFQIIRDLETDRWRVFRPNDADDLDREEDARLAPPLISPRYYDYKKISWENKKEELPKTITMKNGWQIFFFSSLGIPPQGWDIDLACFDEEITHPKWYPEISARLLDRRKRNRKTGKVRSGKFIWSATPQAGTVQLYELFRRAEEEDFEAGKTIEVFHYGMLGNAYISQHSKDSFIRKFASSEEEYRVRVLGQFALLGTRVYGEFMPRGPHGCDAFPIPRDWTRYAVLDPGRQVCAILFAACPPPGLDVVVPGPDGEDVHLGCGRTFLYDELYIKRASAAIVAEEVRRKLGEQVITRWIIDARAGRITEIGSGLTHEEQYRLAFVKAGIFSGPGVLGQPNGFAWSTASGGDDVKAGIEAVRANWHLDDTGRSKWLVLRGKVEKLCWEAEIYSYKRLPDGLVTDEIIKHNDHMMDNLRYLACYRPRYVKPSVVDAAPGYTLKAIAAKKARAKAKAGAGDSIKLY